MARGIPYAAPSFLTSDVPEYWIVHPGAQWPHKADDDGKLLRKTYHD